ncbi:MAG: tRNA (adenosine(37)-N6)-threonylcarbamoyltransferase complex dimerization subunit type 1 TsaB [Pseudomonadota bacterium]
MRLLGFDTSAGRCSAALGEAGAIRVVRSEALARGHAERLMPMLREVMDEAGLAWSDLDALTVTTGPGSFTGVRTAIAAVRGLALAMPAEVLPLTVFAVLADAAIAAAPKDLRPVLVALDARRGQVYAQPFDCRAKALAPPCCETPEVVASLYSKDSRLIGSGASLIAVQIAGDGPRDELIDIELEARYLVEAAYRRIQDGAQLVPGFDVHPLYLRPPDANPAAGRSLLEIAERQ